MSVETVIAVAEKLIHAVTFDDCGESGRAPRDNGFLANARAIRNQCKAAGVAFFGKQNVGKATLPADLAIKQWPR